MDPAFGPSFSVHHDVEQSPMVQSRHAPICHTPEILTGTPFAVSHSATRLESFNSLNGNPSVAGDEQFRLDFTRRQYQVYWRA